MDDPKIRPYFLIEKDGVRGVSSCIANVEIMLDTEDLERYGWVSKKQLDLYLFRHPEYKTDKFKKKKLVSIDILDYLLKNIERKQKQKQ